MNVRKAGLAVAVAKIIQSPRYLIRNINVAGKKAYSGCIIMNKRLSLLSLALLSIYAQSAHAEFTALGDLAGGAFESSATGINADGSVVVGYSESSNGTEAFRWTESGGMIGLGTLPSGGYGSVWETADVSDDGSIVVGSVTNSSGAVEAFKWTQEGGMIALGDLPTSGYESAAFAISGDGQVIVGISRVANPDYVGSSTHEAYRWTQAEGMVGLGYLPGGFSSRAYDINADGSVIVGRGYNSNTEQTEAFRWTLTGGMVGLGDFDGGDFDSSARAVSADGTVIVGSGTSAIGTEAFRWTQATGLVKLGSLSGGYYESLATGLNADGSVVVGTVRNGGTYGVEAFRWTQEAGMQTITQWLASTGVSVSSGFVMLKAHDVSSDGDIVVGMGANASVNQEAFIARAGSGALSLIDFDESLNSSSEIISSGLRQSSTLINGAHSHPMSRRVQEGQNTFWVAGDLGRDDHNNQDGSFGITEIGVGHNYGPLQLNLSLGKTWSDQNLILGGNVDSDGTYLMLEGFIPVSEQHKLFATVGAFGHWGEADIRRGYLNAGLPDFSTASPDTTTWGVRARLDWVDAFAANDTHFTPYADISYTDIEMDGYTESGGGFPATFDKRSENITELRVGLNGTMPIENTGMNLVGGIEAAHRFNDNGARTTGELVGLFAFDLGGQEYNSTWYKAGLGFEGKLGEGKTSLMVNGTTEGEMPNVWLAASYQMSF